MLQQRLRGADGTDFGWRVLSLEKFELLDGAAAVVPALEAELQTAAKAAGGGGGKRGVKRRAAAGCGWEHEEADPALGSEWHCFKRRRPAATGAGAGAEAATLPEHVYVSPFGAAFGSLEAAVRQQQPTSTPTSSSPNPSQPGLSLTPPPPRT